MSAPQPWPAVSVTPTPEQPHTQMAEAVVAPPAMASARRTVGDGAAPSAPSAMELRCQPGLRWHETKTRCCHGRLCYKHQT